MRTMMLLFLIFASLLPAEEHTISAPMPAEDGETCVVCYGRCTRDDVAYLVDGQRFAIMKPLEQEFLKDPDKYITAYRPNSMQFGGPTAMQQPMPFNYIWFGVFIVVALLGAGIYSLRMRHVPGTKSPVPCPTCGRTNHPSANRCLHCGAVLTPTAPSEASGIGR